MKLEIKHQESYSRGELLLRTLFGAFYIGIPHGFLMLFVGIASLFISFLSFWAILFTGRFPKSWFDFQVKFMNWGLRVNASLYNLIDGYPEIGLSGSNENIKLDVPYPESVKRGLVLIRAFFGGIYVACPHFFLLSFRYILFSFIYAISWWAVLFTGRFPASWHNFMVGTFRWQLRVGLYLGYFTDDYPPFSGKE